MSSKGLSKQVQIKIAQLRSRLEKAGQQRSGIDPQLSNLAAEFDKEDEQMLTIVLSDVLKGVDITTRYPVFFQKLLSDDAARRDFLEDLDILVKSKTGELESLPGRPIRDLDFLHTVQPKHDIEISPGGSWRITWVQVTSQLQHIFLSPPLSSEAVYRNDANYLDEISFKLFHSHVDLDSGNVVARLEALQPTSNPEVLQLSLRVAFGGDQEDIDLPKLTAHLHWGAYNATVPVSNKGTALFPELPITMILNQGGAKIGSDLHLMLESSN